MHGHVCRVYMVLSLLLFPLLTFSDLSQILVAVAKYYCSTVSHATSRFLTIVVKLSRYIFKRMLVLRSNETGVFENFVKILGPNPVQGKAEIFVKVPPGLKLS